MFTPIISVVITDENGTPVSQKSATVAAPAAFPIFDTCATAVMRSVLPGVCGVITTSTTRNTGRNVIGIIVPDDNVGVPLQNAQQSS